MSDDGQVRQAVADEDQSEAFQTGLARRNRIIGPAGSTAPTDAPGASIPDLEKMLIEHCLGHGPRTAGAERARA